MCDSYSCVYLFFFFKQKTAYEMRISDWSSDVCSSDLVGLEAFKRSFANYLAEDVRYENVGATLVTNRTEACELIEHFASGLDSVGVDMQIGRASCRERVCQYV